MNNQCEFHGHSKLGCPDCRKEEAKRVKDGIKSGKLIFGVFKWTNENRYPIANAIRTFKIRKAAENYADKHEPVVRTVNTGGAE